MSVELEKIPLLSNSSRTRGGKCVLVIHGGAGTITRQGSTLEQQAQYKVALRIALLAGFDLLQVGGEAMDAAVAAVAAMEDCPLFNAGKGSVFNVDGKNELEASIMLSIPPSSHPAIPATRRGLGLTLLTRARNPSYFVRAMYLSPDLVPHAFLSGPTAEIIGEGLGGDIVEPSYFFTEHRWREHRRGLNLPEEPFPPGCGTVRSEPTAALDQYPTGTVGAVALDARGCIAVVTSTGGRTNKLVGRIGDTPMMGAGFWAEEWPVRWKRRLWNWLARRKHKNRAVGVSGTGDGDFFIRLSTASTLARLMQHSHKSVKEAAESVVKELRDNGGLGGVVALDNAGNVAMPLNCSGMYRGVIRQDGVPRTAIFADDDLAE